MSYLIPRLPPLNPDVAAAARAAVEGTYVPGAASVPASSGAAATGPASTSATSSPSPAARPSQSLEETAAGAGVDADELRRFMAIQPIINEAKAGLPENAQAALHDVVWYVKTQTGGFGDRAELDKLKRRLGRHSDDAIKAAAAAMYRHDADVRAEFPDEGSFIGFVSAVAADRVKVLRGGSAAVPTPRQVTEADVDGWRTEYRNEPTIQAEFFDEGNYVAFRRAEAAGRARRYGGKHRVD